MAGLHSNGIKEPAGFNIAIPAITCSFLCAKHPNAQHLLEVADSWLVDCSKRIAAAWPQSKLAAKLYATDHVVSSAFGLLVTLMYANAVSERRVIPILKLMNWSFLLDNCVDEPGLWGADPAMSSQLLNSIMAVFVPTTNSARQPNPPLSPHDRGDMPQPHVQCGQGGIEHTSRELAHILTSSAAEWWSDMRADLSLPQQARFCEAFRRYLASVLEETHFRSASELPDVQTYLRIRGHSLGWYPLGVLIEYALCMELEQDALANPLLETLTKTVCEAILILNDIASLRKEFERGDYFNLVMVLCFQRLKGTDPSDCMAAAPALDQGSTRIDQVVGQLALTPELLQDSLNKACEMVKERDRQCVGLMEKTRGSQELMQKPGMAAYLEALANHVAGNLYWHFASARYGYCVNGGTYKPGAGTPEELEEGMTRALAAHPLVLKPPHYVAAH